MKSGRLLTWAVSAFALACGPASAQEPVKIGVMLALSGPPGIVDFGESYRQGIEAALEDYEAQGDVVPVELVVYDDEANPQRATSLAQRLIRNDGVVGVIGTVSSGNTLAMAPILQRAGIPLIAGPAAATQITSEFIDQKPSYIFRCSMIEAFQIKAVVDYATAHFDKIGLIHSTSGYGNFSAEGIKEGLKERGRELVATEAVAPGVSDVTPQMIKMRDAGAEIVLHFHESYELLYRPLDRLDYQPVFAGNWGLSSLKVLEIVGASGIEGTVMGQALDLQSPNAVTFSERMTDEYGGDYRWPVVAALGYDAAQIMFKAVNESGGQDGAMLRDAIEAIQEVDAISATPAAPFSSTDHECLSEGDIFLGAWRDGEVVRLDP